MNNKKNTHKIVLLGPQACGKGTQGKILSELFGISRISTGDMFREEITNKSELGIKIQNLISEGRLVSDELTFKLLKKRLSNIDCRNGFILDGYPRNIGQVKYLDSITNIDFVIEIDISNREAVFRIKNRRICDKCGTSYDLKLFPSKNRNRTALRSFSFRRPKASSSKGSICGQASGSLETDCI